MAIVVLTLVIPLLGLAILLIDSRRQTAFPFEQRSTWTTALNVIGVLAIGMGLLAWVTCLNLIVSAQARGTALAAPLLAGLGLITALTGRQTFRLPQSWPMSGEDSCDSSVIERYSPQSLMQETQACHLRSGAWVMLAYPLLYVLPILGLLGAFLLIVAAMAFSAVLQSRRAFQSQLLWLMTIAMRNRLPLAEELRSLSINQGVKRGTALRLAAQDLDHGDTLSMALERHRLLPAAILSAIRVSEGGSHSEETLRRLAIHSTERLKTYSLSKLSEVFLQVTTMLSAWLLIVGFLMYFIIPKFKDIFNGFDVELPKSTQVLIQLSDHFSYASPAIVFWVGIGIALLFWQALRHIVGWSSLPYPAVMHWFPRRDAAEVLRALGGIASEQASLPQKVLLLTDRRGRPDLGARYRRISESLSRGETLSQSLDAEGFLSAPQREAVSAGERGGHLSFVLFALAEAIEQREFRRSAYWSEMLKPVAIVTCGLLTGFVVFAMFVPLIKIINALS